MTPIIRPATEGDSDKIAAILSAFIDETSWMPRVHTLEEDRNFGAFLIEKTDVHVAVVRDVVGFIACRETAVDALYVHADFRRQGIGSCLLNAAKSEMSSLDLWTFQANAAARAFYSVHGFTEGEMTNGDRNDEGLPDVFMTWDRKAT